MIEVSPNQRAVVGGRWWRPNGNGFTDHVDLAGVFPAEEARMWVGATTYNRPVHAGNVYSRATREAMSALADLQQTMIANMSGGSS